MPFIRHSRDKRGFESTYVMHVFRPAATGPSRTRVLYVFRSPGHIRVGRQPLDAEVMEALEHMHPDLNFDWSALHRDAVRSEPREREIPRDRSRGPRPSTPRPAPPPPAAPPAAAPAVPADDRSVLGLALGAVEAARLRRRYDELLQRVTRRARTPEERDRLVERCRRLNPADWPDEAAVRQGVQGIEAEWDAVIALLPPRRRGRRGGRRRPAGPIMESDAGMSAGSEDADLAESNRDSSGSPDDGGIGPAAADATADLPGDD